MTLYFYDKYSTKPGYVTRISKTGGGYWYGVELRWPSDWIVRVTIHEEIVLNEVTGEYSGAGATKVNFGPSGRMPPSDIKEYAGWFVLATEDIRPPYAKSNQAYQLTGSAYKSSNGWEGPLLSLSGDKHESILGKVKNALIGKVVGEMGDYPEDGLEGDYYYIRKGEVTTSRIISPSGGETIDNYYNIMWEDENNSNYDIDFSADNGAVWQRLLSGVGGKSNRFYFKDLEETSMAKLRIRNVYPEGVGSWVVMESVFTIQHDWPPKKPSNLRPKAGDILDITEIQRFYWNHNHNNPQSEFDLEWSTDLINWERINRVSTFEQFAISPDTFPDGDIYWKVRTYSDVGLVSDWSNIEVVLATSPSDDTVILSSNIITNAKPIFQWSQPEQAQYHIQILDRSHSVVWDTGEVFSRNKAIGSGVSLQNGEEYLFRIRTATDLGLWSGWVVQNLDVNYEEPPLPTLSIYKKNGYVEIRINNPIPTGMEPGAEYNDIYRNGKRIAKRVGNIYEDYSLAYGEEYIYKVVAVGTNNNISESNTERATIYFDNSFISNEQGDILEIEVKSSRAMAKRNLGESMFFVGREKPVYQYSSFQENGLNVKFTLYTRGSVEILGRIYEDKSAILYRDNKGRKIYGTIPSIDIDDNLNFDDWVDVSMVIQEIDFDEVI